MEDAAFDAVVSGLVLNFVPDQPRAAAAMRCAARPGGIVAAYVWDYAEGMQMMRRFWDAATALDPEGAGGKDEALRFALCRPGPLRALFEQAGLQAVEVTAIEVPTVFRAELYAVTALAGAAVVVAGHTLDLPPGAVATAGAALCFGMRFMGIRHGWRLPLAAGVEQSTGATNRAVDPPDDARV